MNNRYVTGTEPNKPAEIAQDRAEQTNTGVSGTTHGVNKVTPEDGHKRIQAMQELLRN